MHENNHYNPNAEPLADIDVQLLTDRFAHLVDEGLSAQHMSIGQQIKTEKIGDIDRSMQISSVLLVPKEGRRKSPQEMYTLRRFDYGVGDGLTMTEYQLAPLLVSGKDAAFPVATISMASTAAANFSAGMVDPSDMEGGFIRTLSPSDMLGALDAMKIPNYRELFRLPERVRAHIHKSLEMEDRKGEQLVKSPDEAGLQRRMARIAMFGE